MLKGYRTYLVAIILAVLGFLVEVDWVTFLNDPKGGAGFILGGVLMAVMRIITTTPPGKADGKKDDGTAKQPPDA